MVSMEERIIFRAIGWRHEYKWCSRRESNPHGLAATGF